MAINYVIQADVIDIHTDVPKSTDAFMVDSNVWFWVTYSGASTQAMRYQIVSYPNYVSNALAAGASLLRCGLCMAELVDLIERTEWKIYSSAVQSILRKEYRHNLLSERSRVVSEVQASWAQVKTMATPIDVEINDRVNDAALQRCQNQTVGGYDLLILEIMARENLLQIISDDGDFACVPGIQVLTANRNVLNAARAQGKIVVR